MTHSKSLTAYSVARNIFKYNKSLNILDNFSIAIKGINKKPITAAQRRGVAGC